MACEVWRGKQVETWFDLRSREVKAKSLQRIRNLFFSPNGRTLYAVVGERLVALDPLSGELRWAYTPPRTWAFLVSSPNDAALSDQGWIVVSTDNGMISVLDGDSGQRLYHWKDDEAPRTLFVRENRLIGTDSFRLLVWDIIARRRTLTAPLPARSLAMQLASLDPLAAVRSLEAVYLLELETGKTVAKIPVGMGLPRIQFQPKKRRLAIAERNAVALVDYRGRFLERFEVEGAQALCLTFTPNGRHLLVGCSDRSIRQFELG
jgi:hypothetical protein